MNHKKKIVFAITPTHAYYSELWNEASSLKASEAGFDVHIPQGPPEKVNWAKEFQDAEGIITTWNSPKLDKEILRANSRLKIVGHAAGSLVNYISDYIFEQNIPVVSANCDMAHSVAEWCVMGALMGRRRIMNYSRVGLNGELDWEGRGNCGTLQNTTVGIWGYGAIASNVRAMLKPFLPDKILVDSDHLSDAAAMNDGMQKTSTRELFRESDIIFLLKGLNPATINKIDKNLLESIKDKAVLVNAGRGHLIQEQALLDELKSERFIGVFDVFHKEPVSKSDPLCGYPNVILTPHNAGYPSRGCYVSTIIDDFRNFFSNKKLKNQIVTEKIKHMSMNIAS